MGWKATYIPVSETLMVEYTVVCVVYRCVYSCVFDCWNISTGGDAALIPHNSKSPKVSQFICDWLFGTSGCSGDFQMP